MLDRLERERESKGNVRESIFTEFTERSRVRARVGLRALPIKFRGLTRRRYARSTKADNSILHRSREKGWKRGRESMERHGVVFRRGNPRASSGHASAGFNLPFSLGSSRVLSAHLLLPDVASSGRNDANAVTCTR